MDASVIHSQLRAADTVGLARFYEHVLGWSVEPATMGLGGSDVEGRIGGWRRVPTASRAASFTTIDRQEWSWSPLSTTSQPPSSALSHWAGTPTGRPTTYGCAGRTQESTGASTQRSSIPRATGSA